jgi:hypothetical protein
MSTEKTIHILYDMQYLFHLYAIPHLRNPLSELGYTIFEYFVADDTVAEKTAHIPRDNPSHIIFLHIGIIKYN